MTTQSRAAVALVALAVVIAAACGRPKAPPPHDADAPIPAAQTPEAEGEDQQASSPTETTPEYRSISGEVFYRERLRLPSDAALTVTLLRIDDPGQTVVARSTVTPRPQIPIPFELEYSTADISEGASYALDVEITRRGEVVFALPEPVPVITEGAPETGLRLLLRRLK